MSYFFRHLFHFAKDEDFEASHPRGKSTPDSTPGSVVRRLDAVADRGTPGPAHQMGGMTIHGHIHEALRKVGDFCKRFSGTPREVHQPGIGRTDKAQLVAQAQASKPLYDTWVRGVASVFEAKVFDQVVDGKPPPHQAIEYTRENPEAFVLLLAGVKGEPRLSEKIKKECGGDCSLVTDMVRGTISVPDASRLDDVLDVLEGAGLQVAKAPKDRINNPGPDGYRDIKLNVTMPNGHIAELQVMTHHMLEAKEIIGHHLYNEIRPLLGQLEEEGRDATPEERARIDANFARQFTEAYDPAWRKSLKLLEGPKPVPALPAPRVA